MKIKTAAIIMVLAVFLGAFEYTESWADGNERAKNDAEAILTAQRIDSALLNNQLVSVWTEYLSIIEQSAFAEKQALSSIEDFHRDSTWENLVRARKACIKAIILLQGLQEEAGALELPSEADLSSHFDEGANFSRFVDEIKSSPKKLEEERELMQIYLNLLESASPFIQHHAATLGMMAEFSGLTRIEEAGRCACMLTNYLLLELDQPDTSNAFWNIMPSLFPTLCEMRFDWYDDEDELLEWLAFSEEHLKLLPQQEISLAELLRDRRQEIPAEEQINMITSAPALLPTPAWYDPEKTVFDTELEKAFSAQSIPFEEMPRASCFYIKGVTRADVESYFEEAASYAIDVRSMDENSWDLIMDGYMLTLEWADDMVMVTFRSEDVTFAPTWYIEPSCTKQEKTEGVQNEQ